MSEPAERKKRPRSLGRKIAIGIYWIMMLYMVIVGFYSIFTHVFWPPHSGRQAAAHCSASIRVLRDQLLTRSAAEIRGEVATEESQRDEWIETWEDQFRGLEAQCGERHLDARRNLIRLRHRAESALLGFERDAAHFSRAIDRDLGSESTPSQ